MNQVFRKNVDSLEEIFSFLEIFFAPFRRDRSSEYAVALAIEEIFTNLVKYTPDNGSDVSIALEKTGRQVRVTIDAPDTERFDPTTLPDADTSLPLEKKKIGGLGIHLTRRLIDDIRYSYSDRCSTITLIKDMES